MQLSSKARKVVAAGLTASTFMWSAMLVAPVASAAVHSEGCLVLSGGIVWMITNGTRRGYTSAEVFQSYGYNFSQVVNASAEDVALPVGPIMIYADGTLVKGPNDPLVYLVAGGQKRPFVSGSVFLGLGYSFANIQSAPVNTFSDLPTGANLDSTTIAHPAGTKVISNGAVWLMDNNGRMGFPSAANFLGYGYKFAHVVQANSYDLALSNTGDVPARPACTGGGGPTPPPPPPASGSMSVSLASDNPGVTSLVTTAGSGSQALANMLKLNFSAGSSGATVTTLRFTRTGIASDGDIANLYLYDGTTRLAEMSSVSERVFTFNNGSGLFSVPANSVRTLWLAADITDSGAGLSGKTIGFNVAANTDVVLSGGASASGSYPLVGSVMNTAVVTDMARVTVAAAAPTAPASVDPGSLNRQVLTSLTVLAENQNVALSYVRFTEIGSIANTDLTNLKLMDGATQLGATAQIASDYTVVFDLSSAPYQILSGQTKTLNLTADIIAGTSRSFKFTIQRQSDIVVRDTSYGLYVKPYTNATTETFSIIQPAAATSITSGTLAVTVDTASPTGNVALNSTNIELARFKFVASGEAVKVLSVPVELTLTTATNLKNVKVLVDGSQVGTTLASLATATPATFPASGDFGSSFVIPAGTAGRILSIRADISSTAGGDILAALDTIVAKINAGSANAQGVTSLVSLSSGAANGRTLTVQSGALVAAKNLSVNDGSVTLPTAVKGAAGAKIGSFVLTAGAGEAVSVSQIAVTDTVATATVATTVHGTIANGTGVNIDVASTSPFVVGESYYITLDATPTVDTATITVTAIVDTDSLTVTVSAKTGAGAWGTGVASTIRSAVGATDTLADTFQNMRLMMGATQVGTTVTSLTDTGATVYTFTPSTAITVGAGAQAVFDVFADVKNTATTLSVNSDATGITSLATGAATATGVVTSSTANSTGTPTLQNSFIAAGGTLAVSVSGDSATGQQVVMGTTEVELGKFKLAETSLAESLTVTQIVILDTVSSETHGTVQNLKLYNGATLLGTVATLTRTGATTGTATFGGLNLTVPQGNNVILTLKADITTYPGGSSGSTHLVSVASFAGNGASSGNALVTAVSTGTAGTMTAYRTKLSIAHASDAPSGASSGSAAQLVAKFVVSNTANVGNYAATVKNMNPNVSSTIAIAAASVRYITFYKNSISGTAPNHGNSGVGSGNALGSMATNAGGTCTTAGQLTCTVASPASTFTNAASVAEPAFTDFEVAAGSSVTLFVVADTQDAASTKNFSAGISAGQVSWSDGVTSLITTVDSLPLTGKTLTY